MFGVLENRWQERFGRAEIEALRAALLALTGRLNPDLPDCMPILGYGLFTRIPDKIRNSGSLSDAPLPVLLSRVLLAFAIELERGWDVSLAISANVLRNVKDDGTPVKDLPRMAGVSREAVAMSVSFLEKRGFARKARVLELTAKGRKARDAYWLRTRAIEESWRDHQVRALLERIAPLLAGIDLQGDGWCASVPKPEVLPHFLMDAARWRIPGWQLMQNCGEFACKRVDQNRV